MERIVVAFSSEKARDHIARLLESGGISPAGCCCSGAEAIRTVWNLGDAAVVCGYNLRDMTAVDLAANLWGICSLLVVSTPGNLEFCTGENLFKLATPASRSDLFASLRLLRQEEIQAVRSQALRPGRPEVSDSQAVARAKELLMHINHMGEAEAHRFLQRRSMNSGVRPAEAALWIIAQYQ